MILLILIVILWFFGIGFGTNETLVKSTNKKSQSQSSSPSSQLSARDHHRHLHHRDSRDVHDSAQAEHKRQNSYPYEHISSSQQQQHQQQEQEEQPLHSQQRQQHQPSSDDPLESNLSVMAEKRLQKQIEELKRLHEYEITTLRNQLQQSHALLHRLTVSRENWVRQIDGYTRLSVGVRANDRHHMRDLYFTATNPVADHVTFLHHCNLEKRYSDGVGSLDEFNPKQDFDRYAYMCVSALAATHKTFWGVMLAPSFGFRFVERAAFTFKHKEAMYGALAVRGVQKFARPDSSANELSIAPSASSTRTIAFVSVMFPDDALAENLGDEIVDCLQRLYREFLQKHGIDVSVIGGHFGLTYDQLLALTSSTTRSSPVTVADTVSLGARDQSPKTAASTEPPTTATTPPTPNTSSSSSNNAWLNKDSYEHLNLRATTHRKGTLLSHDFVLASNNVGFAKNFPPSVQLTMSSHSMVSDCLLNLWVPNELCWMNAKIKIID